jgi:peptidyl-dipeptidase A
MCLSLEPDITNIMFKSRDPNLLLAVWKGWHDATGPSMRHIFTQTVEIQNKAAAQSGYSDLSQQWIEELEDEHLEAKAQALLDQIKPLYDELHAYVRGKLEKFYGQSYPRDHDPRLIPAHLLGNMWAQSWTGIYDLVKPFPQAAEPNLVQALKDKNYTAKKIFKDAEGFFTSLGLFPMTPEFWLNSVITKPNDRDIVCHASAWDMSNGYDFRIKMCTDITETDYVTVHHEMGHIEYYMAYSNQPAIFQSGANSAFHEAIGDTVALSVHAPRHFKEIGLTTDDTLSYGNFI